MSKIIIDNRSDLTDYEATGMVLNVIAGGRISNNNKQYCYLTVIGNSRTNKKYQIASILNKRSDRFVINNDQ